MSVKITIPQLQEHLPALLDLAVQNEEELILQRNGEDYAVIVSIRAWQRRQAGRQLDAQGPTYRLAPDKQARVEELLDRQKRESLTPTEQHELNALLRESDDIMLLRADALDKAG